MKYQRFEVVLRKPKDKREQQHVSLYTNATGIAKGSLIKLDRVEWQVAAALPADSNKIQFGDVIHEVKEKTTK